MYQSERKIYPRDVQGRFARLRKLAVWVLLGIFYLIPWLSWGERQAVLFDLPARKFYIFGLNFWPQDFFFLALLLIMAGLSLFFFRSEEHTSELQSLMRISYAVFCLKKKKKQK